MALGRRQVGGWDLWGHGDVPTHACTCTHMHAHAHMHMYTCIEIANGHPHGGIHVYHVYNMFTICMHVCMHACMCVHKHACMGHPPTHPYSPPPQSMHPPPPRGNPWNQSKFNNTWTNQDNLILFEDLKSVETPPPMGGCMVWWLAGSMGGVRSNY